MNKRLILIIIGVFLIIVSIFSFPKITRYVKNEQKVNTRNERIRKYQKTTKTLQDGDIIFQTSKSSQSKAIQLATKSKYSHCGIIYKIENQLYVYEAVQPVKITKLEDWILRDENEHYFVKRLKNSDNILTDENITKLKDTGKRFLGKNYDIYFEWSDDKIYCSELVWKMYKEALNIEIGELQHLKDFDLTNKIVKDKMKERYGDKIPINETVISPESIFNSDKLETIALKTQNK